MFEDSESNTEIPIENETEKLRAQTVDLVETPLIVDISDAVSERDKVKFTVHTRTTLPAFRKTEFSVVREHEEFVWLHDRFVENLDYAGHIVSLTAPFASKQSFDQHTVYDLMRKY